MEQINPYRRNCEVITSFFSKPVFLICGIALLAFTAFKTAFTAVLGSTDLDFICAVAGCIFLLFFFSAKSKNPQTNLRLPVILMKIFSVIGIVLSSALLIYIASFLLGRVIISADTLNTFKIYSLLSDRLSEYSVRAIFAFGAVLAVLALILLLFFVGLLRTACSLDKSLTDIYLRRNGSFMLAVISVILSAVIIIAFIGIYTINNVSILKAIQAKQTTVVCGLAAYLAVFISTAISGFMYSSYIKRISTTIEVGSADIEEESTDESAKAASNQPAPAVGQRVTPQPVSFNPLPVFNTESNDRSNENSHKPPRDNFLSQNPYAKPKKATTKRCSKCGKENPADNSFCGGCGSKI